MQFIKLSEVSKFVRNGASIKQNKTNHEGYPITRIETISNDMFNYDRLGYASITDEKYQAFYLQNYDVLLSHINSEKYLGLVEELIDKKDYLKLAEIKSRYSLRTYETSLEKYTDIIRASEYYSYVYQYTFDYLYRSVEPSFSFMDSISDYTRMIYDTYESVEDPEMKEQVGNVVSDLELFFKTYLKLTDEEIASLPDVTDAQRSVLIEEAIKNAKNE